MSGAAARAWGRLLRLSQAPSAAADVVAGLVYGAGGRFPADARAWWLVPAALGVYHGALVLNDWHDRAHDRATRPERPLPAGAIGERSALLVGLALVLLGIASAGLAAPRCAPWYAVLAALALAYDFAVRGPLAGPLLLGLCRALNLAAGIFLARGLPASGADLVEFAPAAIYGAYVTGVGCLGRLEDRPDPAPLGRAPGAWLSVLAALPLAFLCLPEVARPERLVPLLLALIAALAPWRAARARRVWTGREVECAMGLVLRRLLVCTAIVALLRARFDAADAWLAAIAILLGFPLAHALRRVFPPS